MQTDLYRGDDVLIVFNTIEKKTIFMQVLCPFVCANKTKQNQAITFHIQMWSNVRFILSFRPFIANDNRQKVAITVYQTSIYTRYT